MCVRSPFGVNYPSLAELMFIALILVINVSFMINAVFGSGDDEDEDEDEDVCMYVCIY